MEFLNWPTKAPAEKLDYYIDWSNDLSTGEKVASQTWTVPAGLTGSGAYISDDGKKSFIWLEDGEAATEYEVACAATTDASEPRILTRTVKIRVEEL